MANNESVEPFEAEIIAYLAEVLVEGLIAIEAEKQEVNPEDVVIDFAE